MKRSFLYTFFQVEGMGSLWASLKGLAFAAVAFVIVLWPSQRAFSQTVLSEPGKIQLDVPYEPSSGEVVEAMLRIAKVGKDDLVYDLGCGDGRIIIAAAQKAGARGVGIDLDPQRIQESVENARKANVTRRVRFHQQDLFQTEIEPATVVMLYLYPEVNLKLRPKLLRELTPGTRVVSHSHDMGDWRPDQTIIAPGGHAIHFWVIPANVTGTWEWKMPGEKERYVLKLDQQFQKVSGTLLVGSEEIPVQHLELRGDGLEFSVEGPFPEQMQTRRFRGHVRGHFIEGTTAGLQGNQTWKAERNPSSMKRLNL